MRMRDLARASGLPRTTIHHYLREGLLPPPEKSAANAAVYGEPHLRRLGLLKALRGTELGPLSLAEIRVVLKHVEAGQPPGAAVALAALARRAETGDAAGPGREHVSDRELARRAGLELSELRALREAGALRPASAETGGATQAAPWGAADATAAAACARLLREGHLEPADLRPIVEMLEEMVRYEAVLVDLARSAGADAETGPALRRAFADLHEYLLARSAAG